MSRSYVYFARSPESGLIKIGFSWNVPLRLSMLTRKGEPPVELLAQAEGYQRHEGRVHAALIQHHVGKEWFEPAERVLVLAAALKHGFLTLDNLPDLTSPIRTESSLRGHATRRARLEAACDFSPAQLRGHA